MKKNKKYKSVLVLLFTFQFLFLTDMVAQDFAGNDPANKQIVENSDQKQNVLYGTASSQISIIAEPNEEIPRVISISNDSISLKILINNKLEVSSLKYLPTDIEFIQPGNAMPLVSIDNSWFLNNVGFGIRNVKIIREDEDPKILIHAYSNYLENPFHLYIELGFNNSAEIAVDIKIVNKFKEGYSDYYRDFDKTSIVLGIPWLAFLQPDIGGNRNIVYKKAESYVLENYSESLMRDYHTIDTWERSPKAPSVDLEFYSDPAFPTILEFSDRNISVMLQSDKSDLTLDSKNIKQALWPSNTLEIGKKDTLTIFNGKFKIFSGSWHQGFNSFRNKIRSGFDFTFYERPGFQKYKNDFLAYHSFLYNNRIYDPETNSYLIENFLNNAKKEYGGFDQFYFWHAYPRVGVDSRDQFLLYEDLPGGLDGVKDFINKAHQLNTHVYLAYNPWDITSKRDDMYETQAEILGKVGADGLLLDTMGKSDKKFREAVDQYNPDAQFVTEGRPELEGLEVTTTSWDHPIKSLHMPRVDLLRFIIPEHRSFQIVRWDRDRTLLIKKAFFNATGYAVWDDIFGEINLQSQDEKILIHRYNTIMHDFSDAINSVNVVPLLTTQKEELFVNGFFGKDSKVYTLYQANHAQVSHFFDNRIIGQLFEVEIPDDWHMVDVWNKRPVEIKIEDGKKYAFLPQEMPEDLGCLVASPKLINVEKTLTGWTASVTDMKNGSLELIGFDIALRNEMVKSVNSNLQLEFTKNSVNQTSDGYVMIQYRNENMEVKDVALVKIGY
jgi:hypothetical protein